MKATQKVATFRSWVPVALMLATSAATAQQISFAQDANSSDAFRGTLTASGLTPNSPYIWTINGYAGHKSNPVLIAECEEYAPKKEGYCDNSVSTDGSGGFSVQVDESFPAGRYKVKLLVKDPGNDYSVIWHQDPVTFKIR